MDATDLIRRLHEHRVWVTHQLLDTAQKLTESQLRERFAIGQGSIWKSLVHLYAAEYVWLETLLGDEKPCLPGDLPGKLPGNQEGQGAIASLTELRSKWQQLDLRWQTYLADMTPESLDEIIYKISTSSGHGKRQPTRRGDVLLHVCTHAQYTTAQVINMLRQVGSDVLPDPMLITMARQESAQ